jgi:hypothetical protein
VILEKKEAVIKYSPTEISPPIIAEKIDDMGFPAKIKTVHPATTESMIYNTLHRKLKIVQHEPPQKTQGNSDVPVIIYTHVYLEECLCKSISMTIVCTVVTLL